MKQNAVMCFAVIQKEDEQYTELQMQKCGELKIGICQFNSK